MQPALLNLLNKVSSCSSVEESGVALVHGIAAEIKRAGTDEAKLTTLSITLEQNLNAWSTALAANTHSEAGDEDEAAEEEDEATEEEEGAAPAPAAPTSAGKGKAALGTQQHAANGPMSIGRRRKAETDEAYHQREADAREQVRALGAATVAKKGNAKAAIATASKAKAAPKGKAPAKAKAAPKGKGPAAPTVSRGR